MEGQPPSKLAPSGASRKGFGISDRILPALASKTSRTKVKEGARTTLASKGPQSPRRPKIDPLSDELLTWQSREEALLRAIDDALNRNDDLSAESLRLQLKAMQEQGVGLRETLQLQVCRQKIEEELGTTRTLAAQFVAVNAVVQTLEADIRDSAARTARLEQELDTSLTQGRSVNVRRLDGTPLETMLLTSGDIGSHQQLGRVRHSQLPINAAPQGLVLQEREMSFEIGKPPRSDIGKKTIGEAEGKRHGHGSRKKAAERARKTVDLSTRPDAVIAPTTPLQSNRNTVDTSQPGPGFSLPTFPQWRDSADGDDSRKTWSPRSPGQTPRGGRIQKEKPTLGHRREEIQRIIEKLVGSVKGATIGEIEKALKELELMTGSRINLAKAAQDFQSQAGAMRREMNELQRRANEMEEKASALQNLGGSGVAQCREAILVLKAELKCRSISQEKSIELESFEYRKVESDEMPKVKFGEATMLLNELIGNLTGDLMSLDQKPEGQSALPLGSISAIKSDAESPGGKIDRKIAQHANQLKEFKDQYKRLKENARREEGVLNKWREAKAKLQAPERSSSQGTDDALSEVSMSNE